LNVDQVPQILNFIHAGIVADVGLHGWFASNIFILLHANAVFFFDSVFILRKSRSDLSRFRLAGKLLRDNAGRARVKRLVVYFPNYPQPFPLRLRNVGTREDLAIATVDPDILPADIPALPIDNGSDAATIGKTVVTMGYPSGPDRLLAMVDDDEAKSINQRFGGSRQNLINFLAQSKKITPLLTQGSITDLDARRIVHDAKTAEGGSGAPLFGQSGKVIGVNFGVFTENTAANMAVPVKFAADLLKRSGWKSPEQLQQEADQESANANTSTAAQTHGGGQ